MHIVITAIIFHYFITIITSCTVNLCQLSLLKSFNYSQVYFYTNVGVMIF